MAAPAPIAFVKGASSTTDAASYTPSNSPSGSGGKLFAFIGSNDSAALTVDATSAPDWFKVGQIPSGSTCSLALFENPTGSATALKVNSAANTQYSHQIVRMPADTAVWLGAPGTGTTANPDIPAVDHERSRETYYLTAIARAGTAVVTGVPSGWSNLQTQAGAGANGVSVSLFEKTATSSTENPGAATQTAAQWAGVVAAFWTEPSQSLSAWIPLVQSLSSDFNLIFQSTSLGMGATAGSGGVASNEHETAIPALFADGFTACKTSKANWVGNNGVNVTSGQLNAYDNRRTPGAAWDHSVGLGYTTLGGGFLTGPTSGQVLAFVPGVSFDRTDIYYAKYSGSPQYTGRIDAGSTTTLLMNAASGIGMQTVSGSGTTVNIASTGAGGFILATNTRLNGVPQMSVFGAGFFGANTTQMAEAVNFWGPMEAVKFMAPKAAVLEGGANDTFTLPTPTQAEIDTYKTNCRKMAITHLRSAAMVCFWIKPLVDAVTYGVSEAAQKVAMGWCVEVADELNLARLVLYQRIGWRTWAESVTYGFMDAGGDPHPTLAGQADIAAALLDLLDPGPLVQNLAAPLLTNTSVLFAPTVTPGAVTLSPGLLANASTIYAPTITPGSVTLSPGLLTNTSTVFTPTVSQGGGTQNLAAPLLTNTSTAYAPTVAPGTITLSAPLLANSSALYPPLVTPGAVTLSPPLLTNVSTIYPPTVIVPGAAQYLTASLLTNLSVIYPPAVVGQLSPGTYPLSIGGGGTVVIELINGSATVVGGSITFTGSVVAEALKGRP